MPVLMVTAYDENGTVQVMNAALGMICGMDKVALFIDEDHATTKAIRKTGAFTVSLADRDHMDAADYYGIATGNKMPDKYAKSGYHTEKSEFVNAPMMLSGFDGKWEEEFVTLSYDADRAVREMEEERLPEQAPGWYRITKQVILGGTVTHLTVLSRAAGLYRQDTGIQNWRNVPEKYWNLALDEFGL